MCLGNFKRGKVKIVHMHSGSPSCPFFCFIFWAQKKCTFVLFKVYLLYLQKVKHTSFFARGQSSIYTTVFSFCQVPSSFCFRLSAQKHCLFTAFLDPNRSILNFFFSLKPSYFTTFVKAARAKPLPCGLSLCLRVQQSLVSLYPRSC